MFGGNDLVEGERKAPRGEMALRRPHAVFVVLSLASAARAPAAPTLHSSAAARSPTSLERRPRGASMRSRDRVRGFTWRGRVARGRFREGDRERSRSRVRRSRGGGEGGGGGGGKHGEEERLWRREG